MKRALPIIVALLAVVGLFSTYSEYRFETELAKTNDGLARVVGEVPSYAGEDIAAQASAVLKEAETIGSNSTLASGLLEAKARVLVFQLANKLDVLCIGIDKLSQLSSSMPYSAEAYVLLVEMLSLSNSGQGCTKNLTITFDDALSAIEKLAAVNTPLLYRAGVAAVGLDRSEDGMRLLSKAQMLDPEFTDDQQNFLFELVNNQRDLKAALPATYPVITDWVNYFYNKRRYNFDLWQESFIKAVNLAVTDLDERFSSGRIEVGSLAAAIKEIALLPTTYLDDSLRRRLDIILQRIYSLEGATRWADFIATRAQLKRLPVLKSEIVDDRSSRAQQLYGWMPDSSSSWGEFDRLGNAIGIFVPAGWTPNYIVLQGQVGGRVEKELALDIWVSEDNLHYYQLPLEERIQQLTVDGIDRIVIPARSLTAPYIKIRYLGSNQNPQLTNRYGALVEVYGDSNEG